MHPRWRRRHLGPRRPVDTLDGLLAHRAAERPDHTFLRFADGDLTFAETDGRVNAVAGGLVGLGIGRGQLVPVLLPNGAEFVVTWLGLCRLGALPTLVNTALRGPALAPRWAPGVGTVPE